MADIVGYLAAPASFCYVLFAFGLLARFVPKLRSWSWPSLALSGAINVLFSTGAFAAILTSPLEYAHPALVSIDGRGDIRHIVALTGWAADDADLPVSGRLNQPSAFRVMLTLEYARECPDCNIVVSGTSFAAPAMRDALVAFGVDSQRITVDGAAPSTMDSATNIRRLVGTDRFYLVTSAGHMPRSLLAMKTLGLQPVPAPTDYRLPADWRNAEWLPRPLTLEAANLAVHEYVGLAWYWLRSR